MTAAAGNFLEGETVDRCGFKRIRVSVGGAPDIRLVKSRAEAGRPQDSEAVAGDRALSSRNAPDRDGFGFGALINPMDSPLESASATAIPKIPTSPAAALKASAATN